MMTPAPGEPPPLHAHGHRLLQLGALLFLLGLLVGFLVPLLASPRMGLASHLEGLLNGMFLIVLGLLWPRLLLGPRAAGWLFWLAVYGTFANWATPQEPRRTPALLAIAIGACDAPRIHCKCVSPRLPGARLPLRAKEALMTTCWDWKLLPTLAAALAMTAVGCHASAGTRDTAGSCTPACSDKVCGLDGCGGTCGTCGAGSICNTSGQCTPGACAVSTPNVPDGPDPWGGCFPGPSNTGVPPGTVLSDYTGPCTITAANTVIDGKTVRCDISVRAAGLIIRNSVVKGSVLQADGNSGAFTISDSLIDGNNPWACINCGVGNRNFTLLRTEIIGTNRGAYCEKDCLIKDSWIHGTNLEPVAENLAHASAVRVEQGTVLTHNSLACDFTGPFPNDELGCSADITGYPDFAPIHDNTITNNLLVSNNEGIGFCAYGGGTRTKPYSGDPTNATSVAFIDNVFQRGANGKCGAYGAITDFLAGNTGNRWTGNRWDDGAAVDPD